MWIQLQFAANTAEIQKSDENKKDSQGTENSKNVNNFSVAQTGATLRPFQQAALFLFYLQDMYMFT